MGFWRDFSSVFKKNRLTFVEKQQEAGNVVSFLFRLGEPAFWTAGQHGIFTFPGKLEGRSWRAFSLSSAPYEAEVRITTRISDTPSPYKQALMALTPGDQMIMRGPFGPFFLDGSKRPVVFIAGGIGITPYRALIGNAVRNKGKAPASIHLIYADDRGEYAFRNELEAMVEQDGFVTTDYTTSKEVPDKIASSIAKWGNGALYYVSGPVGMVSAVKRMLRDQGIGGKNIKSDLFMGL